MVITSSIESITPETAGDYLARNTRNRRIRSRRVKRYAAEMAAGRWRITNDAIVFDELGHLQNGQHRLLAVIESGRTISALVARGLPQDSYAVTDIGDRRSMGDLLYASGEDTMATELGAAAKMLFRWYSYGTFQKTGGAHSSRPEGAADQILDIIDAHPRLRETIHLGARMGRRFVGGYGLWGALTYLILEVDPEAGGFFEDVYEGAGMDASDPAWRLRERLVDRRTRLLTHEIAALVVKAWRHQRDGRKIQVLTWNALEEFPPISLETEDDRQRRLARERRANGARPKRERATSWSRLGVES